MNDDLHEGRYNAEISEDGFIRLIRDCRNEELFTRYGEKYNWDNIKQRSLTGLSDELSNLFPGSSRWIRREWGELRSSNRAVDKWIKKLIEGKCGTNELHGIKCWIDGTVDTNEVMEQEDERIMGFLTYGPNATKYNYKHYGCEGGSEERMVDEERETRSGRKTRGALSRFTTWDGANTRPGLVRQLRSTDNGNPVIVGLIDKVMRENRNSVTEGEKLAPRPAGKELGKGRD